MRAIIFIVTVHHAASLLYILDIIHYENIITNIMNNPEKKDHGMLLRTMQSYVHLLKNVTEDLKRYNKDVFRSCKIVFNKGWPIKKKGYPS